MCDRLVEEPMILGTLTPNERAGLDAVARACGDRFRPWTRVSTSRTVLRALAKLGLVDMRTGEHDGMRLVRLSKLAVDAIRRETPDGVRAHSSTPEVLFRRAYPTVGT